MTPLTPSEIGREDPIPDLNRINWEGREVYICFDPDWESNSGVRLARTQLFKLVKARKANQRAFDVPTTAGVKGVDERIASEGPDAALAA
jgi:Domain of unknown function (DUF3854)